MQVTEQDIQVIVQQVLQKTMQSLSNEPSSMVDSDKKVTQCQIMNMDEKGVYPTIDEAVDAAHNAYKLLGEYSLSDRQRFIEAIKDLALREKHILAKMVVEETGLGNYQDKIAKHELAARTGGTEILKSQVKTGDTGLALIEEAPFGVIGATTPVTNPTETVISNAIAMIAAGNTVVFNVHPSSKNSARYVLNKINEVVIEAGGPANIITMVGEPSIESLEALSQNPKINLLVGTGGPGLVKSLLKSGKKAIGAGAGNPPVLVDQTADIKKAAADIIKGHSFDNNIVCILEKEVFVMEEVANQLIEEMKLNGAYYLGADRIKSLENLVIKDGHIVKAWVGKDAYKYLEAIGEQFLTKPKCVICEVPFEHAFVQLELLMPILPIVRVKSFEEGIRYSVEAEHGNRHTAIVHSQNISNITAFAKAINTTIFVKNAPSLAGIGVGSESTVSFTIAGPTGEGITTAKDFTRARHCVLVDGFRII